MVGMMRYRLIWFLKLQNQYNGISKGKTEALKYNTRKEFAQNCYSAYNYARKNKLLDTVCLHMLSSMPIKKRTEKN